MRNIANAIIDGNLVQDPEMKRTKSEKTVTSFYVAVNHEWGSKDGNNHVSYIPVETWEKLAENCGQYLKKGRRVTVEGELRQDRWVDEGGRVHSRIKIVARNVRFDSVPRKDDQAGAAEEAREDAA
jgi:single-strand DNA-binding protein